MLNPAAEVLTGWTQSDAIGRPIDEVMILLDAVTHRPCKSCAPSHSNRLHGESQPSEQSPDGTPGQGIPDQRQCGAHP